MVRVDPDQLAVADIIRPGRPAVRLAGKRPALARGLGRPAARQARGRERPEVAPLPADGLDNHEILLLALELVHLHRLKQVVGGVLHDDLRRVAKVAREPVDGHARAVDAAVVAREEEVHGRVVADDRLVDGTRGRAADAACEERLRGTPAVGVGRVVAGLVGEGVWAPCVE
jgi:hypothetical protein